MNQNKNYFIQTFAIMVLSVVAFVFIKPFLPTKLFPVSESNLKNIVVDSLMLEALEEDLLNTASLDSLGIINQQIVFNETDYVGYQHLVSFYKKLNQIENGDNTKIRIAFFGDSMNDGDMIVKDFRANFQDRFGGEGVGFVNITSESAASRGTIKHLYSQKWKSYSFVNTKNLFTAFGISGNVFFPKDTTATNWVSFEASKINHLTELSNPTLFYGKSESNQGQVVVINGKDTIYKNLNPIQLVNEISLGNTSQKLKLDFKRAGNIPFYGVDFSGRKGVYVDNFSNRGNSGLPIANIKPEVLSGFNKDLHYDLIVLQYGTNVLGYGTKNFSWYENKMKKVLTHLQEAMPNVPILIISIADKATKYDSKMQTDSAVVPLVKSQLNYAKQSNATFINLFQLMGGENSMVKWADEDPAKANKDYTHLNFRGSKFVSDLIYNKIMLGYDEYKKQSNK